MHEHFNGMTYFAPSEGQIPYPGDRNSTILVEGFLVYKNME